MKKHLITLVFLFSFYFVNANTIRIDSLFKFVNEQKEILKKKDFNSLITDSTIISHLEFCKLFNVTTNAKTNLSNSYKLYYIKEELVKVKIINPKAKIEYLFYNLKKEDVNILLSTGEGFFIIPQNEFFIFFSFIYDYEGMKLNTYTLDQITAVNSDFVPLTKLYPNDNMIHASSNFIKKGKKIFEDIIINRQDIGKCITLDNKKLSFLIIYFEKKGIFSCNGFFKKYRIELEKKFYIKGGFWFINHYTQSHDIILE